MSKVRISEGEDFIIERHSRTENTPAIEAFKVDGRSGAVTGANGASLGADQVARDAAAAALARTAVINYDTFDLPDADITIYGDYGVYVVRQVDHVSTYTGNHDVHLSTAGGPSLKQELTIITEGTYPFQSSKLMNIFDDGPAGAETSIDVTSLSQKVVFVFDGTNWLLDRVSRLRAS